MVTYQFEIDTDTWNQWKETVPRTKKLDERLIELIEADTEGRVREPKEPTPPEPYNPDRHLKGVEFPSTVNRADAIDAIGAAREYLHKNGQATMRDFVTHVMPRYPLGYEVPELEPGERYRGAWWRKVVKPGLEALPGIDAPSDGRRTWRFE
jgi:hypothetical protein